MKFHESLLLAALLPATGCVVGEELSTSSLQSAVLVEDSAWRLTAQIHLPEVRAARSSPVDGLIYAVRRSPGAAGGVYQIDETGAYAQLNRIDRVAGLAISPFDGGVFTSEDFAGYIKRTDPATGKLTHWVAGFHAGDDDPVGIAIAGDDYTGDVIAPGEALVVDRGSGGSTEVWRFSTTTAEGEARVRGDDGQLANPVDVAIGTDAVYIADLDRGDIYELAADGSLSSIGSPVAEPNSVSVDRATGEIYAMDGATGSVVRFAPGGGTPTTVLTGVVSGRWNWSGVDVDAARGRLVVTDTSAGMIYVLEANRPPVALCEDRAVVVEDACEADVSVDAGSHDPDGDPIDVVASPAGPYPLGTTVVTLTVTDPAGQQATCAATVTVELAGELYALEAEDAGSCRLGSGAWLPGLYCGGPAYLSLEEARLAVEAGAAHFTGSAVVEHSGCRGGEHEGDRWALDVWMDEVSGGHATWGRAFKIRDAESGWTQVDGEGHIEFVDRGGRWSRVPHALLVTVPWRASPSLAAAFFFKGPGHRARAPLGVLNADLAPLCAQ